MNIPYERIIQWVSGPFSVFIGGLATKWVTTWHFLGALGLPSTGVARAITSAVVFLAASGVTYLGHHKWLTNAAKWWTESGMALPAIMESDGPPSEVPTSHNQVIPATSTADALRAQLQSHGITPGV